MLAYKLHEAAKRTDIDEVRELVSESANVNEYDSEGSFTATFPYNIERL